MRKTTSLLWNNLGKEENKQEQMKFWCCGPVSTLQLRPSTMKLFSCLMALLLFLLQAVPGLGLPKDTQHCLEYHGYCFHLKSCPKPFAAFGTCYRRRKTCCIDTTSNFHICQEEGGHCVPPEIRCLQEQVGLCPRRGWKCCTEV
ncbi:gallinacin-11-like [Pipra filicauda]|uniref:Gallinacin-11-like n=1 Tax=Pipra filicauda TaxID=649802 RepID=A0A7R5KJN3_9PASS|nr:gallinacin-11-like [Pipra filicauda]